MDYKLLLEAILGLISVASTVAYISYRVGKLEVKVDTLWDFMMRRATSEAVVKDVGSLNSPFVVSDEVRSWFSPEFIASLKTDYSNRWIGMEDKEIFLEIEKKYGDQLIKQICIPHGLFSGACLIAAIEIAKGK